MRDSQRKAVYAWEDAVKKAYPGAAKEISLDECKALVAEVWTDYRPGERPPEVSDGRGTRLAKGGRWRINLPRWARSKIVVLHETAHSLRRNLDEPWHGREFATLLLDLWEHYAGIPVGPVKSLGVHQRPRRVRFAAAPRQDGDTNGQSIR